jgi:hypothetical protein
MISLHGFFSVDKRRAHKTKLSQTTAQKPANVNRYSREISETALK